MTTKKIDKSKHKIVPFNKTNTLALADMISRDKDGVVSYLKLCENTLSNGKDGKRTLHCAIGEAYHFFASNDMKAITKINDRYQSKYLGQKHGYSQGSTAAAIDALVDQAQLKNPTDANKIKLAVLLTGIVGINDSLDSYNFALRAQRVALLFRKNIAPLLK